MDLNEQVEQLVKGLDVPSRHASNVLKRKQDGLLFVVRHSEGELYYKYETASGKRLYLGKDDAGEIAKLEEQAYCRRLKKTVEEERRALERVRSILERMPRWENVFLDIPKERRHLIKPCIPASMTVDWDEWNRKGQFGRWNGPETGLVTVNGEKVRSKSELVIADRFRANGVPYHYESPVRVGDRRQARYVVLHPDFLVMNARTGQQYYWEHLGMLDNPEYCAEWLHRAEVYADNGIIIGKNLIVSAESSAHPLDTGYVDCLIEEFLK